MGLSLQLSLNVSQQKEGGGKQLFLRNSINIKLICLTNHTLALNRVCFMFMFAFCVRGTISQYCMKNIGLARLTRMDVLENMGLDRNAGPTIAYEGGQPDCSHLGSRLIHFLSLPD